jgi:putative serine/threonine protein kinase
MTYFKASYSFYRSQTNGPTSRGENLQQSEVISLEHLLEKKYAEILCYPRYDQKEAEKRLVELKKLGVEALEFVGDKGAFNVQVLGKGCVGIVVVAHTKADKAALKIRRVDADRAAMQREANMLKKANEAGVGPKLLGVTQNFLLMKFIEGVHLPEWITNLKGRGTKAKVRKVLMEILEQCWRLDSIGLDHGELSRAPKHVIVSLEAKPYIVDFETASVHRKVSNVTSMCQFLFIGSQLAKTIKKKFGKVDVKKLIEALKGYKQNRTRENFEKVLVTCGLKR